MKDDLFNTVVSYESLNWAWKSVLSKDSSGGIDDVTVESFGRKLKTNIEKLRNSLLQGQWTPQPYLNVKIPKKNDGERTIGLLSVDDKIVQTSIKMTIEPILERTFSRSSYAYRPGRGHQKCVRRALQETRVHKTGFHIRCDIDNFFATIDRELLMTRLRQVIKDEKVLQLVDLCLSVGSVEKSLKWVDTEKGIPQGAILSPMLANFYLNSFDQSIDNRGISYLRYSDDIVMWTESREKAETVSAIVTEFLSTKLGLSLNAPPEIAPCSEPFEFLGIVLSTSVASISESKAKELTECISNIEIGRSGPSKNYWKQIDGINRYYLSVLPETYRNVFKQIFDSVVEEWKLKDVKVPAAIAKEIRIRLLGNCHSSSESKMKSTENMTKKQALIAKRKSEYRRLESENSELVIAGAGYFIGAGQRGIIVRKSGQPMKLNSAAVKHISILSGGVAISSNLIEYCSKNNIAIDFFGEHCTHLASVLSPPMMNSKLWSAQILISNQSALEIAKAIMIGKLKNQINLCKYFNKYHKKYDSDCDFQNVVKSFKDAETSILKLSFKEEEDYRKMIMGYEASAADIYWTYIRVLLDDDKVEFYSRVKQGAKDLVNCMLNYGYSLLYPRIWQSLLKRGLNPYIGFIHHSVGNSNLVFDFIEMFRCQVVDRIVVSMLQRKIKCQVTKDGMLDDKTRNALAQNIMSRFYRYETYRGESRRLCDIIDIQANDLACSIETGSKFKPYLAKW